MSVDRAPGPLAGYRVVDVCRAGPGRWASGILADYGADVISVVDPGHAANQPKVDPTWKGFGQVNARNKRSILLDLKKPRDVEVAHALLAVSDAILESNRPGVATRLAIDYETIRGVNPRIVYVSLSAFGQHGPYAEIGAHDLSFQAVAGAVPLDEADVPFLPPINTADRNAAHFGAMAVLMALLEREQSDLGQYVDISFTDVAVQIPPGRMPEEALRGAHPAYNLYETKDHRYLTLSIREPAFWKRFCDLMGRPEWSSHQRPDGQLREEMFEFVRSFFKTRPLSDWIDILKREDIAFAPVNRTVEELAADPQLAEREMLRETVDPVTGETSLEPGLALKFSRTPGVIVRDRTVMGSDTEDILEELGLGQSADARV
jgi:crotonobetainyl-CoA:carnitine CoA-transferase CaiB-like acyl-CoA transferase